jgi:hypothetical protein
LPSLHDLESTLTDVSQNLTFQYSDFFPHITQFNNSTKYNVFKVNNNNNNNLL